MKFFCSILILFFCSCNSNQSEKSISTDKLGLDTASETYSVTGSDISMNLAIEKAKKTISEFDIALESNNPLYTDFAVKKRFNTKDDGGEHMWIAGIKIVNGYYHGFVNNDAEITTEVKYGDTVIVKKSEITDWMYLDNNTLRGGYTIREIRSKMTKEEREQMDANSSYKIED
ncbi:MAG: DUF2314 domain-containing protein [Ferruginibacter sp.]|nr:DUF2314 domain-containing protein [Ferruginibacter sp.]